MTLTGMLMATSHSFPGFGEFLLSHSHAIYYSPYTNTYHMGSWAWLSDLSQYDTVFRNQFSKLSTTVTTMQINCCFSNTGHYYINSSDCGMFLYYLHSMTCAAMKQMCVNVDCFLTVVVNLKGGFGT